MKAEPLPEVECGNTGAGVVWVNVQMDEGNLPDDSDMDAAPMGLWRFDAMG
jgi:hypothetical protein